MDLVRGRGKGVRTIIVTEGQRMVAAVTGQWDVRHTIRWAAQSGSGACTHDGHLSREAGHKFERYGQPYDFAGAARPATFFMHGTGIWGYPALPSDR
jgi:hypothetical protein